MRNHTENYLFWVNYNSKSGSIIQSYAALLSCAASHKLNPFNTITIYVHIPGKYIGHGPSDC